jgi:hypothetical protein
LPGKYKQTLRACYLGLVTQAININLAPLFFVIFHDQFGLSFEMLGRLVLLNFTTQLAVELAALKFVDRIGYRASVIIAHSLSCLGSSGWEYCPALCLTQHWPWQRPCSPWPAAEGSWRS